MQSNILLKMLQKEKKPTFSYKYLCKSIAMLVFKNQLRPITTMLHNKTPLWIWWCESLSCPRSASLGYDDLLSSRWVGMTAQGLPGGEEQQLSLHEGGIIRPWWEPSSILLALQAAPTSHVVVYYAPQWLHARDRTILETTDAYCQLFRCYFSDTFGKRMHLPTLNINVVFKSPPFLAIWSCGE